MNKKGIKKHLSYKIEDWLASIEDIELRKKVSKNVIVTGGALVSLLEGNNPNDYDIYFKDAETTAAVAAYYIDLWNKTHKDAGKRVVELMVDDKKVLGPFQKLVKDDSRIQCFIRSAGTVEVDTDEIEFEDEQVAHDKEVEGLIDDCNPDRAKYVPRFFSTNAISLSDKIQIVIRFYGDVETIHTNYDFIHCTCSYDHANGEVRLPAEALAAIINKELYYVGSKYPLCSIIRTKKFIKRGWNINAGQYVKMALQLNELNLKSLSVFKDQLVGVDSVYFNRAIEYLQKKHGEEEEFELPYMLEIINKIF